MDTTTADRPCIEMVEACGEWFVRVVEDDQELTLWPMRRAGGGVSSLIILYAHRKRPGGCMWQGDLATLTRRSAPFKNGLNGALI